MQSGSDTSSVAAGICSAHAASPAKASCVLPSSSSATPCGAGEGMPGSPWGARAGTSTKVVGAGTDSEGWGELGPCWTFLLLSTAASPAALDCGRLSDAPSAASANAALNAVLLFALLASLPVLPAVSAGARA